jgi:hypothetical protein
MLQLTVAFFQEKPMAPKTQAEIKSLLDTITKAIVERDTFFEPDPAKPISNLPATEKELAKLSEYWGLVLPASYRLALLASNGITRFWHDLSLLSTLEVVEDKYDVKSFQEFFPKLYRFVFACGKDSYDAFAFDPSAKTEGELAVVQLGDEGESGRWPSFSLFLEDYLTKLQEEIAKERADREKLEN